jgi:hypothetical protein
MMSQQFNEILGVLKQFLNDAPFIKFSILPAILLISAAAGLNFWLKMEVLLSLLFGVALMFDPVAKVFLEFQVII